MTQTNWALKNLERFRRLTDEVLEVSLETLCSLASTCGVDRLVDPEISVEAVDCAGNESNDTVRLRGRMMLRPKLCGD